MGGDVFGNGMLASEQIRLIAAFNHLHIFIDPDPDIAAAYVERKRLFAGPASSWRDYDERLISRGGGVFDRSAKTIELSDQARAALAIEARRMAPDALINAILKAPVDLLWNGGIGTYVKASTQSHTDVGDRANDTLRVDGRELRARVVGEGGNLGLTQAGRIEYALNGGKLNTDAIDNSGGVDSSDMEVNIKIALGTVEAAGRIDREARNTLLAEMTPSVIDLVLRTNYLQTQQISLMETESVARFDEQISFMRALERDGRLDRRLEGLPDDETIETRRRERAGLTRPELSVLISYNKLTLSAAALEGGLADDPWMESWLTDGFPPRLVERFPEAVTEHRLKRELIATLVTNQMVDRLGIATAHRLPAGFSARMEAAVRGYVLAEGWLEGETLFNAIEALDNVIPAAEQYRAYRIVIGLLKHAMNWWLTSTGTGQDISDLMAPLPSRCTASVVGSGGSAGGQLCRTLGEHAGGLAGHRYGRRAGASNRLGRCRRRHHGYRLARREPRSARGGRGRYLLSPRRHPRRAVAAGSNPSTAGQRPLAGPGADQPAQRQLSDPSATGRPGAGNRGRRSAGRVVRGARAHPGLRRRPLGGTPGHRAAGTGASHRCCARSGAARPARAVQPGRSCLAVTPPGGPRPRHAQSASRRR